MNDAIERVKCLHTFPNRTEEEDAERHTLLLQWARSMNESHDPIHARVITLESLHEPTLAEQDELWYKKNLLDHNLRCALGSSLEEAIIYGRSMTPTRGNYLQHPFHPCMNSKEWEAEQRLCVGAHIGDIIFLKRMTTSLPTVLVTYALRRIDSPFRWTKYVIYHSPQESCVELMNNIMLRYEPSYDW